MGFHPSLESVKKKAEVILYAYQVPTQVPLA